MSNIIAFSGSARKDSFNKLLINNAAAFGKDLAKITVIDLSDFSMPIYDGDYESQNGVPEKAKELFELFKTHSAIMISSPEYNSGLSPLLTNTIDWVTRVSASDPLSSFKGKPIQLLSASPGALGGLRNLYQLRDLFSNIYAHVMPNLFTLPAAHQAFDEHGKFKDAATAQRLENTVQQFIDFTKKF